MESRGRNFLEYFEPSRRDSLNSKAVLDRGRLDVLRKEDATSQSEPQRNF